MEYVRTPEAKSCWKSDGKSVPKTTEIPVKAVSPGRHLGGKQTLYASKSISGNGPTSG